MHLLVLILFQLLFFPGPAWGSVSAGMGPEYFDWRELDAGGKQFLEESGFRYAFRLDWTQDRKDRVFFGYGGKLYLGAVKYDGQTLDTKAPVTTTTDYSGFQNEGNLNLRYSINTAVWLDVTTGLGWDHWNRNIQGQMEDYDIVYVKLGPRLSQKGEEGFWFTIGGKYPLYTFENAHLTDIGFDRNPPLHPGRQLTLYANFGFRFNPQFEIVMDYDAYRFSESPQEAVIWIGHGPRLVQQPESNMWILGLQLVLHFRQRPPDPSLPAIDSSASDSLK